MLVCANCGRESEGDFAFCPHCGAELRTLAVREQRKTVTVLFCDVTGSTALGESADPEALRALLARYFERMKGIVDSHGGSVEKFIGDAVMALFGVPTVHEDDALRAVRAAAEMRDALPELGVKARIGVSTGEVVTGTQERLATGDAVNVAARLEQAAAPGEILIGEATHALVREAVDVEELEPLELKGKAKPVAAYRLVQIHELPEPRHEAVFVGRARELATLHGAWRSVVSERRCKLVTVVGEAGVGKSRLVEEFLPSNATVVRGRCLPYGEGITYWPVVEVIKQLGALPSDAAAAASLSSLLGETERGTSAEEIAWAFRKLLEEQAREQPLVCLFDDLQWGEETFLDLLEHVALLSSGAPILLLSMARPDLSERRPYWPVALRLEPLAESDADSLLPEAMPANRRERITRAAGGNPLFITEMLAMAEQADGELAVPPSLKALLAARLDQLDTAERSVLERGAVEGEIFHRGSVQALLDDGQVTPRLASLVRKDLIRPNRSQLPGEDGFRFRHLLIRDAAYDALPKATRAELHERFAAWLEPKGVDLVELDEILGFHLEQATRYKQELGEPDPALALRAGERFAAAGRRVLWRGDERTAVTLLERALMLTRPIRLDVHLELDLATAVPTPREAAAIAEAASERARAGGGECAEAVTRLAAASYRALFEPEPKLDELELLARTAQPVVEEADDHAGLVHVWRVRGMLSNFRGHFAEWAEAAERAIRHARRGERTRFLGALAGALVMGPTPADEALDALDAALPEAPHPVYRLHRAWLLAMLERFDEAWPIAYEADKRWGELVGESGGQYLLAEIATLAGDAETAVRHLHRHCAFVERGGYRAVLSTYAARLGRSLCALGRYDEAEERARVGRELGGEQDVMTQMLWRQVQARVHAHRGEQAKSAALAREAVAIAERTDGLNWQGDAVCDFAEVLHDAGRVNEAAEALEQALDRYESKKNLAMIAQVRPRLDELRSHTA